MRRTWTSIAVVSWWLVTLAAPAVAQDDACVEAQIHRDKEERFRTRGGPALGVGIASLVAAGLLVGGGSQLAVDSAASGDLSRDAPAAIGLVIGGTVAGGIGAGFTIGGGVSLTLSAVQKDLTEDDSYRCLHQNESAYDDRPGSRPGALETIKGLTITLEDGRRYAVHSQDAEVISRWLRGERIVFSETLLLNRTRMEAVSASALGKDPGEAAASQAERVGPASENRPGPGVPEISEIGFDGGYVTLASGQVFAVAAADRSIASKWSVGAQVVFDATEGKLLNLRDLSAVRAHLEE